MFSLDGEKRKTCVLFIGRRINNLIVFPLVNKASIDNIYFYISL